MEKRRTTLYSGFSVIAEILIRVLMFLFIPIYLIYIFISKFIKNVFNDVYGRLVKYVGLIIFIGLIGFVYNILKK